MHRPGSHTPVTFGYHTTYLPPSVATAQGLLVDPPEKTFEWCDKGVYLFKHIDGALNWYERSHGEFIYRVECAGTPQEIDNMLGKCAFRVMTDVDGTRITHVPVEEAYAISKKLREERYQESVLRYAL